MADTPAEPKRYTLTDVISAFIVIFVIGKLLQNIQQGIQERSGFDILNPVESYKNTAELTSATPLGTRVETIQEAGVFRTPSTFDLIGYQSEGVFGRLTDGPEFGPGGTWWEVDFVEGADGWVEQDVMETNTPLSAFDGFVIIYSIIALLLSGIFLYGIIYATLRINQVRLEEKKKFQAAQPKEPRVYRNARWDHVQNLVSSQNPSDWRQAIIEADIILDELVTRMGLPGQNLGEKLKAAEPSDFLTLEQAWQAHKVRNQIAHAGSDFILTQREAVRVIDLYRQVFEEFYYI